MSDSDRKNSPPYVWCICPEDAAKLWGISLEKLLAAQAQGQLEFYDLEGEQVFLRRELRDWMRSNDGDPILFYRRTCEQAREQLENIAEIIDWLIAQMEFANGGSQ